MNREQNLEKISSVERISLDELAAEFLTQQTLDNIEEITWSAIAELNFSISRNRLKASGNVDLPLDKRIISLIVGITVMLWSLSHYLPLDPGLVKKLLLEIVNNILQ